MKRIVWSCCLGLLWCSLWAAPTSWTTVSPLLRNQAVSAAAASEMGYAVGLSQGGMKVFSSDGKMVDSLVDSQFGSRQRISDLAWWRNWIIVGSEGGVSIWDIRRHVWAVHLSNAQLGFRQAGAYSLQIRDNELWIGGLGQLAMVDLEQKAVISTYDLPGAPGRVQALLVLGSNVWVGTEMTGVRVLDLSRRSWKGFDNFDGLPDNCVTGLELVGSQVVVGTLRGLGRIDLSLQSASAVEGLFIVTYMTQRNGLILFSTLEGVFSYDPITGKTDKVEFRKAMMPAGDLAFAKDRLLLGSENAGVILADWSPTLLGDASLRVSSQGISFFINQKALGNDKLSVRMWVPERPQAVLLLNSHMNASQNEFQVVLPEDAVGYMVVELMVERDGALIERRTLQFNRQKLSPSIEIEPVPVFVRTSPLLVRGRVLDRGASSLLWTPKSNKIVIDTKGNFQSWVVLDSGSNRLELVAKTPMGGDVRYPIQTYLDSIPPRFRWKVVDTVSEPNAHWMIPFREAHLKSIRVEPQERVVVTVGDSILHLSFHNLPVGISQFHLRAEDEAGNLFEKVFAITYADDRTRIVKNLAKPDSVSVRVDTLVKIVNGPCLSSVQDSQGEKAVYFVRYHLKRGETLRLVAERFYGDREMFVVIARYNKIEDPEEMCRLPIGKLLLVPFWQGFTHGEWNVDDGIKSFEKAVHQ